MGQGPSLYPEDLFGRAKVQELIRYLELYIELPARRLYGEVFFEKPATSAEKAAVKALLERGFTALARVAKFSPYVAGEQFTYADIYFNFSVSPATIVCKKALDWDAYNQVPNIKALLESLVQRDSIKQVIADRAQAA